jgi:hypothetical protein
MPKTNRAYFPKRVQRKYGRVEHQDFTARDLLTSRCMRKQI